MEFGRVYLDSNVIISLLSGDAGRISKLLIEIVAAVRNSSVAPFFTSELTIAEALVRPYRQADSEAVRTIDSVLTTGDWLEVGPVDRAVLTVAAQLRAAYRHLRLPDAIHVSTAIGFQCSHLLTADTGIRDTYSATEIRWSTHRTSALVEVIRPDETTLRHIIEWLGS